MVVNIQPVTTNNQVSKKRPNMVEYYKSLVKNSGVKAPVFPTELSEVGKGIRSSLTSGLDEQKKAATQATLERMNKQGMLGRGTITEGALQEFVEKPYATASAQALKQALMQQYGMSREDWRQERGELSGLAGQQAGQEYKAGSEYGYDEEGAARTKYGYETGELGLTPEYIKKQREEEDFLKRIAILPEASRNAAIQAYIAKNPDFAGDTKGIAESDIGEVMDKDWLGVVQNPRKIQKSTGKNVRYDSTLGRWVYA